MPEGSGSFTIIKNNVAPLRVQSHIMLARKAAWYKLRSYFKQTIVAFYNEVCFKCQKVLAVQVRSVINRNYDFIINLVRLDRRCA